LNSYWYIQIVGTRLGELEKLESQGLIAILSATKIKPDGRADAD